MILISFPYLFYSCFTPIYVSQSFTTPIFLLPLFFGKKTQAKIGGEGKRQRRETTAHIKIIKKGGEGEGG
jgi:hypothetical protein